MIKKLLIIALILILVIPLSVYSKEKIVICYDHWPPSTIIPTKDSLKRGFFIEILEHIYESAGYEVEYNVCPYARCVSDCSAGKCDLVAEVVADLKDIDNYFEVKLDFPKNESFSYKYVFFVNIDSNWKYDGVKSLQDKLLADIVGYDYTMLDENYEKFLKDKKNDKVVYRASGNDAVQNILKRIADKRVDLFCESELVGKYYIQKLGLQDKVKIAGYLENKLILKPAFTPNSKKTKKLMEIWDKGIKKIKANKEHIKFLKNYIDLNEYKNSFGDY